MKLFITLVVLFASNTLYAQNVTNAQNWKCFQAEIKACKDLVNAEVSWEQVTRSELRELCGKSARACAKLSITKKSCVIYSRVGKKMSDRTATHEVNHCFGWTHGHSQHSHGSFWTPFAPVSRLIATGKLVVKEVLSHE
jgi:hypothetical protein